MAKELPADVKVSADMVIRESAAAYQKVIGELVHENALLSAAGEQLTAQVSELRSQNEALQTLLSETDPESGSEIVVKA